MKLKIAYSCSHCEIMQHFASMFPESEIHVLGITKEQIPWMTAPVEEMCRYNLHYHTIPLEEEKVDKDTYDILIEKAEADQYNRNWMPVSETWDIPRVYYLTWCCAERRHFEHWKKIGDYPMFFANETILENHKDRIKDLKEFRGVIYFTADEWKKPWIGDKQRIMSVCNGFYSWRDELDANRKFWKALEEKLGKESCYMHDKWVKKLDERELIEETRHSRAWFENDRTVGRAITNTLVQSMAIGLPVFAWESGTSQMWRFIKNYENGLYTRDTDKMIEAIKAVLEDKNLAKEYSKVSRQIYEEKCSWRIIKPRWEEAIESAIDLWEKKH